jgi:hypothetical protein
MDGSTIFGLCAAAVGLFDLVYVYLRGGTLPLRVRNMRIFGASLMFLIAAVVLLRIVKLESLS